MYTYMLYCTTQIYIYSYIYWSQCISFIPFYISPYDYIFRIVFLPVRFAKSEWQATLSMSYMALQSVQVFCCCAACTLALALALVSAQFMFIGLGKTLVMRLHNLLWIEHQHHCFAECSVPIHMTAIFVIKVIRVSWSNSFFKRISHFLYNHAKQNTHKHLFYT